MPLQNPNAIGAVPAQGNPQQGQTPKLNPQQMDALRRDPEISQAVSKFMGRPVPMQNVPDDLLVQVAGMVHKLGVDGAIEKFMQTVPPNVIAEIKGSMK